MLYFVLQRSTMQKITIDVAPKNIKKVLSILEALQPELIEKVQLSNTQKTGAKPVKSSLNKTNSSSRYLSKEAYKQKLQKPVVKDDEFLSASPSSSKYLKPNEYKKRLQS